ncbi:TIGR02677 family protein [Bacillus mangrovi]|uniref:TIGR02677 family protein n=1 Tax=Metabacillus mangrovi TaxID=1491830 RepID=A0A7X2V5N6_9BACI|nr:TIGR02677 family protein [Metabacillus mangrovi]MTH54253.1 TIGR02677 family protein [Metabacillus mangrovi]
MQPHLQKKIKEATYLTADKAWSYRPILRYFYIQHERMREFLLPEEIYEYLSRFSEFSDYTVESLQQDLDSLTRWGNLIASQEHRKAKTIDEYKKKSFRYQCTPYTVEFERMMMQLENMGESFGGSLERTQFERLYQVLVTIAGTIADDQIEKDEESAQVWEDAMTYFRQITQNTSDYIAYIHSEEVADRMKTEAFLAYKDQFTAYLRDFIIALQRTAMQIQELLSRLPAEKLEPFFKQVIHHQEQTFRFETELITDPMEEMMEKWTNLIAWFLGNKHGESEFERLQNRTDEAIRRITRTVQRLGERHQQFRSRKNDYLHLAKWFDGMGTIEEAHKLSSVAFGVFHTRHFHADETGTEDIYADIWDEAPMEHQTKPRIRSFRERTRAGSIEDNQEKIAKMKQTHLEQRRREKKVIEQYIQGGEIRIKDLPKVEAHVRKLLLVWIGKAMAREDKTVKTEFGRKVRVILHEKERVILAADDGSLEMPDATFVFVEEEAGV